MSRGHFWTSKEANGTPAEILPISVLIMSDVRFLRESLAKLFARDHTLSLADCVADLDEALAKILALHPDIVLIDRAFPNGFEAVRRIRDLAPKVRIVALALDEAEECIIPWAEAGVSGYIPRSVALSELTHVLRNTMRGEQTCSARVAASLLRRIARPVASVNGPIHPSAGINLTPREFQIAQLIGSGLSNKEIARHLKIELSTTKSHVHNLLGKLNLRRRTQVALWLHRHAGRGIGPST